MSDSKKKKSKWGINTKKVFCPNCNEEQPKVRKPKNLRQFLWGGFTCNNCSCEMDKYGNEIKK